MLSRYEQEKSGIAFPEEWTKKFQDVLSSTYERDLAARGMHPSVYAMGYSNEILLIVTLSDQNAKAIPVSYFASCDLDSKKAPLKQLQILSDSVGVFLDQYFAEEDWNDFIDLWTEADLKDLKFFYKVVRENVGLTLEADRLLAEYKE